MTEAVHEQVEEGIAFSMPHPIQIEVAELIVEAVPCAEMVRFGKNGNAGQRCLANEVVVNIDDIYDDLRERLVEGAEALTVSVGTDEETDIAPVITPSHASVPTR